MTVRRLRKGESRFRMASTESGLCTWLRALLVLLRLQTAPQPCRVLGKRAGEVERGCWEFVPLYTG